MNKIETEFGPATLIDVKTLNNIELFTQATNFALLAAEGYPGAVIRLCELRKEQERRGLAERRGESQ